VLGPKWVCWVKTVSHIQKTGGVGPTGKKDISILIKAKRVNSSGQKQTELKKELALCDQPSMCSRGAIRGARGGGEKKNKVTEKKLPRRYLAWVN